MRSPRAIVTLLIGVAAAALAASPQLPRESAVAAEPEGFHQLLPQEKLEVFGKVENEVFQLSLLARLCSHEVDALFGDHRVPSHLVSFYAMNISYEESAFKNWDFPLRTNAPLEETVAGIFQGLLLRQARERLGTSLRKANAPASLSFLAAALTNRIVNDGKGIRGLYQKDYRIPRRQFAQGRYPEAARLLAAPPPSAARLVNRLYLVHCDLLLSCLENARGHRLRGLLLEWWRLECQEKLPVAEALAQALQIPPEQLQKWYVSNATAQARLGVRGESSETVAARLEKLLTMPVAEVGSLDGVRTIRIEELPRVLKNRPPDVAALVNVQLDLLQLKLASPPIFQAAIDLYSVAVGDLCNNDLKHFKKSWASAQREFQAALQRQQQITRLLDEVERTRAPIDALRAAAWNAILRHRAALRTPADRAAGVLE